MAGDPARLPGATMSKRRPKDDSFAANESGLWLPSRRLPGPNRRRLESRRFLPGRPCCCGEGGGGEEGCSPCGAGLGLAPAEFDIDISGIVDGYNCDESGCAGLNGSFTVGSLFISASGETCTWDYDTEIALCDHTTAFLRLQMTHATSTVTLHVTWVANSSSPHADPWAVLCEFRESFSKPFNCLTFDDDLASYRQHGFYHCWTASATCAVAAVTP